MTETQRGALSSMMQAILACSCCPPDIRFRAENLAIKLSGNPMDDIMEMVRRAGGSTTRH
ncbi:hypothetical protein [Methylobacterium aquaticum]|uniref:Uncharacterized protein n=1 Tax=Methylobacterium aquaticum TaxID=270351 RepID=A0A0J6SL16_9HYPH|nr:hypothetical protein [Methylobacterium aquaticum]KMO34312.1 hypothetical protein VP06_14695 [Methylobacterium aquaticum]